jgi:hypothetical protein
MFYLLERGKKRGFKKIREKSTEIKERERKSSRTCAKRKQQPRTI